VRAVALYSRAADGSVQIETHVPYGVTLANAGETAVGNAGAGVVTG
jgi:hypothetical protein